MCRYTETIICYVILIAGYEYANECKLIGVTFSDSSIVCAIFSLFDFLKAKFPWLSNIFYINFEFYIRRRWLNMAKMRT